MNRAAQHLEQRAHEQQQRRHDLEQRAPWPDQEPEQEPEQRATEQRMTAREAYLMVRGWC